MIDTVEPIEKFADLRKGILIPREEFELWLEMWDWTIHQLARSEFPAPFTSLDEFQLACICADPVLWCQAFLREPEDPDHAEPYNFFEYQKEAIRYPGHVFHKDGSEVGKTREIIAYCMYQAYTTANGSGLNGAPQQTHLEEIIEGMLDQMAFNPELEKSLTKYKKHPHHTFYFSNRFKLYFRPSGFDGEAYRGVHVRTFAIKDEAAKDKNKKQWSEFWRSMKPGCIGRIYSVPDGDRSCDYYKLGQRAIKTDNVGVNGCSPITRNLLMSLFRIQKAKLLGDRILPMPSIKEIYERQVQENKMDTPVKPEYDGENDSGLVGATLCGCPVFEMPVDDTDCRGAPTAPDIQEVQIDSLKDAGSHIQNIKFKLFQWPKTLMPEPYWSVERRKFYIDLYNGEDSAEYKHNVLGEDGDPESSVFPWEQFRLCIKDVPEYRCLKILVNSSSNEVSVDGYKCEFTPGDSGPVLREISIIDTYYRKSGFFDYDSVGANGRSPLQTDESDFRRLIKSFFSSVPGLKRGGADFGFSGDPTEIIVKSIIGNRERMVARLQLKHVTYDQQAEALDALDEVFGPPETISWGTDFGNAGSAVAHNLQGLPQYAHKNYEDRLKGFMFESTTDNVDEYGEPIMDAKTEKPAKITLKELATDHMVKKMQRVEIEYPPDPDYAHYYPNHTVSNAGKHRIYKKKDDHLIDAERCEKLAKLLQTETEDLFA